MSTVIVCPEHGTFKLPRDGVFCPACLAERDHQKLEEGWRAHEGRVNWMFLNGLTWGTPEQREAIECVRKLIMNLELPAAQPVEGWKP